MPEPSASRRIEAVRALWGAALLISPRIVLENIHGVRADARSITVARVLGARHVAQAALSGARPTPAILALGAWVDTAHAATALALAAADRPRARAALTDAALAGTWAIAGLRDARQRREPAGTDQPLRDRLATAALQHLPGGRAAGSWRRTSASAGSTST